MGELSKRLNARIHRRRQKVLDGGYNCIPSPFERFRRDFPGLMEDQYLCVTSFTKGGKTQFVLNLLFEALWFSFHHPGVMDMQVIYFTLEEMDEKILARYYCWLLFRIDGIVVSKEDLDSIDHNRPLSKEVIDKIESPEYVQYIEFFENTVTFSETSNPTGIHKECKKIILENGEAIFKMVDSTDKLGNPIQVKTFDHYEKHNPNKLIIGVVDHISLVESEQGLSKKESIDKLSAEYFTKSLRNKYKMCIIDIQQQSTEMESNDAFKLGRIRPSSTGLADSKYTARDCNMLLGLFSPFKFGLKEYMGYDITKLKDHIRFLEVCLNRDGELGGMIALFFNGANSTFHELPRPDEKHLMKEVYDYVDYLDSRYEKKPEKVAMTLLRRVKSLIKS